MNTQSFRFPACHALLALLLGSLLPFATAQEGAPGFTGFLFLTDSQGTYAAINSALAASGQSTSGYPQAYANAHPTHPVWHLGQPGRALGTPAMRDDNSNTHYGQWSQILAATASDVIIEDGPNNFGNAVYANPTVYVDALQVFTKELREKGKKVHVATIPPGSSSYVPNATGAYNAWRDAVNTLILTRGPALADSFLPFGSHPYFGTSAAPGAGISGDGLHWSTIGQVAVGAVLNAALPAITTGSTATAPAKGEWFGADIPAAAADSISEREWLVTGLGVNVTATLTISGPGGSFRVGSGDFGTAKQTVRNGDLVTLRVVAAATPRTVTVAIGTGSDTVTVTTAKGQAATTVFSATNKYKDTILSYGGKRMATTFGGAFMGARSTTAAAGKKYAEITIIALPSVDSPFIGVVSATYSSGLTANAAPPNGPSDGAYVRGNPPSAMLAAPGTNAPNQWSNDDLTEGDVVGIAVDASAGKAWFRLNGTWLPGDPATSTGGVALTLDAWYLFGMMRGGGLLELNCGQEPFAHPLPAGFSAWE